MHGQIRLAKACISLCCIIMTLYTIMPQGTWEADQVSGIEGTQELRNIVPVIYVITPTYARLTQKADMTRFMQTLKLVTYLHWVVVEDSNITTILVKKILERSGLSYTHLHISKDNQYNLKDGDKYNKFSRGVIQRNLALTWIYNNAEIEGVVYFGDDDNSYDTRLFEEMRYTKGMSVWPVAFVGGDRYAAPIVTNGQVTGWLTRYRPERKFPVDMAMFAINVRKLKENKPMFEYHSKGKLENNFLEELKIELKDLEPKADNCTKILVWHTRTEDPKNYFINANSSERPLEI